MWVGVGVGVGVCVSVCVCVCVLKGYAHDVERSRYNHIYLSSCSLSTVTPNTICWLDLRTAKRIALQANTIIFIGVLLVFHLVSYLQLPF